MFSYLSQPMCLLLNKTQKTAKDVTELFPEGPPPRQCGFAIPFVTQTFILFFCRSSFLYLITKLQYTCILSGPSQWYRARVCSTRTARSSVLSCLVMSYLCSSSCVFQQKGGKKSLPFSPPADCKARAQMFLNLQSRRRNLELKILEELWQELQARKPNKEMARTPTEWIFVENHGTEPSSLEWPVPSGEQNLKNGGVGKSLNPAQQRMMHDRERHRPCRRTCTLNSSPCQRRVTCMVFGTGFRCRRLWYCRKPRAQRPLFSQPRDHGLAGRLYRSPCRDLALKFASATGFVFSAAASPSTLALLFRLLAVHCYNVGQFITALRWRTGGVYMPF